MLLFAINGATSASYTASRECKVALACAATTSGTTIAVNGVTVFNCAVSTGAGVMSDMVYLWISAGESITVTTVTGSSCVGTALLE